MYTSEFEIVNVVFEDSFVRLSLVIDTCITQVFRWWQWIQSPAGQTKRFKKREKGSVLENSQEKEYQKLSLTVSLNNSKFIHKKVHKQICRQIQMVSVLSTDRSSKFRPRRHTTYFITDIQAKSALGGQVSLSRCT